MFIEWTECSVALPKTRLMTRMTSCHIENLEMDIVGPSLAIDGAEVMGQALITATQSISTLNST